LREREVRELVAFLERVFRPKNNYITTARAVAFALVAFISFEMTKPPTPVQAIILVGAFLNGSILVANLIRRWRERDRRLLREAISLLEDVVVAFDMHSVPRITLPARVAIAKARSKLAEVNKAHSLSLNIPVMPLANRDDSDWAVWMVQVPKLIEQCHNRIVDLTVDTVPWWKKTWDLFRGHRTSS